MLINPCFDTSKLMPWIVGHLDYLNEQIRALESCEFRIHVQRLGKQQDDTAATASFLAGMRRRRDELKALCEEMKPAEFQNQIV